MPKHKSRNTFYGITWEVIIVLIKLGQFMSYYKRKKNFTETATWKLNWGPFVIAKNWAQPLLYNEIFEASYLC